MNLFSVGRAVPRILGAAALLTAASVALVASPASAHAPLVSSDPSDGAVVQTLPSTVTFTFGEDVFAPAYVTVTDPDGISVSNGDPTINGAVVTEQLRTDGAPNGTYTASYRVVSDDGHPVSKTIHFSVGAPSATEDSSNSWWHDHWWYVLIAAVIVLGGAAAAFARSRKA